MNINYPHTPIIRNAFALIIIYLQNGLFICYAAASYFLFKNGEDYGLSDILRAFGLNAPLLMVWLTLTIIYAMCFVFISTLSAICSMEQSLFLLANRLSSETPTPSKKSIPIVIEIYLKNFWESQNSFTYDSNYGASRQHESYGLMIARGLGDEYHNHQKSFKNLWGLIGGKSQFCHLIENASITFVQPLNFATVDRNHISNPKGLIQSMPGLSSSSTIYVTVDDRFIKSLTNAFSQENNSNSAPTIYKSISIYGRYYLTTSFLDDNLIINNFEFNEYLSYSPEELIDHLCAKEYITDEWKKSIRDQMRNN